MQRSGPNEIAKIEGSQSLYRNPAGNMPTLPADREPGPGTWRTAMINRQNWLDTRAYIKHLERQGDKHPETLRKYKMQLRHLLEWADEAALAKAS
jgi:hypothetical protein